MRRTIEIHGIWLKDAGAQLWNALHSIVPDQIDAPNVFGCSLPEGDPRVPELLRALKAAGWGPEPREFHSGGSNARFYRYFVGQIPEDKDLSTSEYLHLQPQSILNVVFAEWNPDGRLRLLYPDLRKHGMNGFAFSHCSAVLTSDPLRQTIALAGLKGAMFRPTLLKDDGKMYPGGKSLEYRELPWSTVPDSPWWELTSDVIVPRLNARTPLRDKDWNPVRDDFSTGCFVAPIDFEMPGLHYARSALKKLPKFDIALTFEHWGTGATPPDRFGWLQDRIISQRFYQFIRRHKLKARVWPVHIDEDL